MPELPVNEPERIVVMGRYEVDKRDIFLVLLSLLIPPLGPIARRGFESKECVISVFLYIFVLHIVLFIYSLYVIYDTSVIYGNIASGEYLVIEDEETVIEHTPAVQESGVYRDLDSLPNYDERTRLGSSDTPLNDNKIQR